MRPGQLPTASRALQALSSSIPFYVAGIGQPDLVDVDPVLGVGDADDHRLDGQAAVAAVDSVDNDNTVSGLGHGATTDVEDQAAGAGSRIHGAASHDAVLGARGADVLPGNNVPGVQTGGRAIDGTPAFMVQKSVGGPVSAEAAVVQAAYEVLYYVYPAQRANSSLARR